MSCLGLDVGGANLKAACATGWARSLPFALWRDPQGLAGALTTLLDSAPPADRLAVTMSGELCDCFQTKTEGVLHILNAVRSVADGREVQVYLVDGRHIPLDQASSSPVLAAASNWRAVAEFACRFVPKGAGMLIDIGSTTADVIPLLDGQVAAQGRNDIERLAARELVYSGVGRTPVCAVVRELPWQGQICPLAAEVFSTTADAYVVLAAIDEDPNATWTADGRPLTVECARQRLARQLCSDADDFAAADLVGMASAVRDAQLDQLKESIAAVVGSRGMGPPPGTVIVSGPGEFLAWAAVDLVLPEWGIVSLSDRLGVDVSQCGPAFALAVLADEQSQSAL
jgi:(4-(4-[2-(gamma-L-glutamylamino)ethyl]phenoxymethyl)furan-2-yl)methanamine synthase